ncbi:hypothetical protein QWY77_02860 [Thalassotalea ponticola]|uniref:hypothetical protein n=1 Tax=Thalassotalea ponticola TaxID=1523392 RepID=UPI0025B2EE1D|nr:hypothetical protein [Thalassotalea ponticola]MDN3651704.1 hypothetical protein [Thalassotalea ponticola]
MDGGKSLSDTPLSELTRTLETLLAEINNDVLANDTEMQSSVTNTHVYHGEKKMPTAAINHPRGSVLIFVLILLVIVLFVANAIYKTGLNQSAQLKSFFNQQRAHANSEALYRYGKNKLQQYIANGNDLTAIQGFYRGIDNSLTLDLVDWQTGERVSDNSEIVAVYLGKSDNNISGGSNSATSLPRHHLFHLFTRTKVNNDAHFQQVHLIAIEVVANNAP